MRWPDPSPDPEPVIQSVEIHATITHVDGTVTDLGLIATTEEPDGNDPVS